MNISIISLLLICSGGVIMALNFHCPPEEEMTCTCTEAIDTTVHCEAENIQSDEDLKSNLEAMKGHYISKFTLKDIQLNKAEEDTFEGQYIMHISLDNVTVLDESFKEGLEFFKGLENYLKYLWIQRSYNEGTPLKYFKVSHLQKLETLTMHDNKIEEIGNDWFPEGPHTLKYLVLMGNGIKKLGDHAFTSLTGLTTLWMTDNYFSELTREMFPQQAPHIRRIGLANNKIAHFPTDVFHGMPKLEIVYLENNLITTLDEHIEPSGVEQIVKFFLTGNPIKCDQDIKWLCDDRRANINYFTCDSPDEFKGKLFSSFCDMKI